MSREDLRSTFGRDTEVNQPRPLTNSRTELANFTCKNTQRCEFGVHTLKWVNSNALVATNQKIRLKKTWKPETNFIIHR